MMRMLNFIFFVLFTNGVHASLDDTLSLNGNSSDTTTTEKSNSSNNSKRSAVIALKREIAYTRYQDLLTGMPEHLGEQAIDQFILLERAEINSESFITAINKFADLQLSCAAKNTDHHIDNPRKDSKNLRKLMLIKELTGFLINLKQAGLNDQYSLSKIYAQLKFDTTDGLVTTFFVARIIELIKAVIHNKERFPPLRSEYISEEKQTERLFTHTSLGDSVSRKKLPPIETASTSHRAQIFRRLLRFDVR